MKYCPVKISVIIPVYNVEKHLSACLTSCINQTLFDVEFICVNDGSTDNSLEILNKFAAIDNRIKIIDKQNEGVSVARNVGLDAAKGKYVMFLDADDYLEENACERVWIETIEAPTDIVIFTSAIFPDNPPPTDWHYQVCYAPTRRYWEFSPLVLFGEPCTRPYIWHQAYRKEILDENNIRFPEGVALGEDTVFLLKVYPHSQYFSFIQDTLHNYRWFREGSAMFKAASNYDKKIEDDISVVKMICDYWHEQGWLEDWPLAFLGWMLDFIVYTIREHKSKKTKEHYKNLAELIKKYELEEYLSDLLPHHKELAAPIKKHLKP